jgi:hypothetical protein
MPLFSYDPKVDKDWQYEQVRSEIKRLREVLHNPNLTAEERAIAQSQLANHLARPTARRGTRILAPVRLKIIGQSRVGTQHIELTSAVTVNCHGCLCLSRYEYPRNSSMTLEVSNLQTGRKSAPVLAKVRFIRLPGNPRELYSVGVELETPANIWGVESVPEDWLPYLDRVSGAAGTTQGVGRGHEIQAAAQTEQVKLIPERSNELETSAKVSSPPESVPSQPSRYKTENPAMTPDELNRAWETTLREAAEQVTTSAVTSHVNTAVKEAAKATEIANQESTLKIAGGFRDCDTILVPAYVGFFGRLNKELADASDCLFERAAAFVTRTQTIPQSLGAENRAAVIQTAPAEVKAFSKQLVSGQVSVRAGKDVRYRVQIDTSKMLEPAVTGWFRASGGPTSDIALVLATEQEFENLIHGREARVLFAVDSIKSGEFHVSIAQSGTYILALNNRFSIFTPRTFAANIDLRYSIP